MPISPAERHTVDVDIGGHHLQLSNLAKVLYPATGFTKGEVIDYYRRIAPVMLPHLAQRPVTLVRAPNGVDGQRFFEKRCPPHHPQWVTTGPAHGYEGCLIESMPALVWTANLAAIELHTQQARCDAPDHPTAVVLDLDPGPGTDLRTCRDIALLLRDWLSQLGLQCVVKTSGSKGLHLSVPVHGSGATDDDTKRFALALGQLLEQRLPDRVTTIMAKAERGGKVFVDWSQNDRHKTTVAPYSLRLRDTPTVSTPITWDELEAMCEPEELAFDAAAVCERVAAGDDPYAINCTLEQRLPLL